jgi:hypothetical protein
VLRRILLSVAVLLGCSTIAHAEPKDDIAAAIQKVLDAGNYSWSSSIGAGAQIGKTQKDGFTTVSIPVGANSFEFVIKGDKAAIKTADGWKMASDILSAPDPSGGPPSSDRFLAIKALAFKAPIAQAQSWIYQFQNVQKGDDAYSADLSADAVKQILGPRAKAAQNGDNSKNSDPEIKDGKASVKFWITDGSVAKMAVHLTATMAINNQDRNIDVTITTVVKDVGSTTVDVPDDVKSKF